MKCLLPILINFVMPYTKIDVQVISRSKHVCRSRYKSCTKKIIKQGPLAYHVVCYNKENKNDR